MEKGGTDHRPMAASALAAVRGSWTAPTRRGSGRAARGVRKMRRMATVGVLFGVGVLVVRAGEFVDDLPDVAGVRSPAWQVLAMAPDRTGRYGLSMVRDPPSVGR